MLRTIALVLLILLILGALPLYPTAQAEDTTRAVAACCC